MLGARFLRPHPAPTRPAAPPLEISPRRFEVIVYFTVIPAKTGTQRSAAMTITAHRKPARRLIRHIVNRLTSIAFLTAFLLAQPIMAQTSNPAPATRLPNDKMVAIEIPEQPDAIELGTGPLPGATTQESWHSQYNS
jgi:hypothetical protein